MKTMLGVRILIVEDQPLFREGVIKAVIRAHPNAQVLCADDLSTVPTLLKQHGPVELAVVSMCLADAEPQTVLKLMAESVQCAHVLALLSPSCEPSQEAVSMFGAMGVSRAATIEEVSQYVQTALCCAPADDPAPNGHSAIGDDNRTCAKLTPAQRQVLIGLMDGRLNKQIAYEMQISEATVKAHVTAIFRKLGVRTRTQAVIAARSLELDVIDA